MHRHVFPDSAWRQKMKDSRGYCLNWNPFGHITLAWSWGQCVIKVSLPGELLAPRGSLILPYKKTKCTLLHQDDVFRNNRQSLFLESKNGVGHNILHRERNCPQYLPCIQQGCCQERTFHRYSCPLLSQHFSEPLSLTCTRAEAVPFSPADAKLCPDSLSYPSFPGWA